MDITFFDSLSNNVATDHVNDCRVFYHGYGFLNADSCALVEGFFHAENYLSFLKGFAEDLSITNSEEHVSADSSDVHVDIQL